MNSSNKEQGLAGYGWQNAKLCWTSAARRRELAAIREDPVLLMTGMKAALADLWMYRHEQDHDGLVTPDLHEFRAKPIDRHHQNTRYGNIE